MAPSATSTELMTAACTAGLVSAFSHHTSEKPVTGQPAMRLGLNEFVTITISGT